MRANEEMSDPTLQQNRSQASGPGEFPGVGGANVPCGREFRFAAEMHSGGVAGRSVV